MERIVIMVRDEVGVLSEITRVLANAEINVETINTQVNGEQGNIIISTDDTDRALFVLTDAGYTAVADDSLLLRLKDEPGALARVSRQLSDAGINIQSLHILDRKDGFSTVALSIVQADRARAERMLGSDSVL